MYIKRIISTVCRDITKAFPALLITGPRQSGKTTFLKHEFPDAQYISFDDPVMQNFAHNDPEGFLSKFDSSQIILDEIQYVPHLFSFLKMKIDADRRNMGKWLLTGSQQFNVMKEVSDSLAGRIAIIDLFPFSYFELPEISEDVSEMIFNGLYPEVALNREIRNIWYSSYIRTYIERDVRQIINVQDTLLFQNFIQLLAAHSSQESNIAGISRELGVSQPTIKRWISILQSSFIVYLLNPYYKKLKKRLIKSPKIYFIDSGIAAYLTRQPNAAALICGSMGGAFFESFIVIETYKIISSKKENAEMYFWRSHDGLEVDLILEIQGMVFPIEIKKTASPTIRHADNLEKFNKISENPHPENAIIVCNIEKEKYISKNVTALPWKQYLEKIRSL